MSDSTVELFETLTTVLLYCWLFGFALLLFWFGNYRPAGGILVFRDVGQLDESGKRAPVTPQTARHLLLTGPPGSGKTTVIERVVERLADLRLAGFYTREIRRDERRVGFEAVGLNGTVVQLAHIESRSPPRVGKYGVLLNDFEELVRAEHAAGRPPSRPAGGTRTE